MMIPMNDHTYFRNRIAQLEQTLFLSLEILQTVLDRLETKFGEDFSTHQAQSALSIQADKDAQEIVKQIEELSKQGQHSAAVKTFREEFHLTWDEAHFTLGQWSSLSMERKIRVVRLNRWMRAVSGTSPSNPTV